jgi:hypothetical protein
MKDHRFFGLALLLAPLFVVSIFTPGTRTNQGNYPQPTTSVPLISTVTPASEGEEVSDTTSPITILTEETTTTRAVKVDLRDNRVQVLAMLANEDENSNGSGHQSLESMKDRLANESESYNEWVIIGADPGDGGCPADTNCTQGLTCISGECPPQWDLYGDRWKDQGNIGFTAFNLPQISVGDSQTEAHRFMTVGGRPRVLWYGDGKTEGPTCDPTYNSSDGTTTFTLPGEPKEVFDGDVRSWCTNEGPVGVVGYSADRQHLYLAVSTGGQTITELAQWLKEQGAAEVLRLNGGNTTGLYYQVNDNDTVLVGNGSSPLASALAIRVRKLSPPDPPEGTPYTLSRGDALTLKVVSAWPQGETLSAGEPVYPIVEIETNGRQFDCSQSILDNLNKGYPPLKCEPDGRNRYRFVAEEPMGIVSKSESIVGTTAVEAEESTSRWQIWQRQEYIGPTVELWYAQAQSTGIIPDNEGVFLCPGTTDNDCIRFTDDENNLTRRNINDDAASIKIEGNWEVVLYTEPYYKGEHQVFSEDTSDLGGMSDKASSLRVRRTGENFARVSFYTEHNQQGQAWHSDRDIANFSHWFSEASLPSFKEVCAQDGHQLILFGNPIYREITKTVEKAHCDNITGSPASVRACSNACPPTPAPPTLQGPEDGATFFRDEPLTFSWENTGAPGYEVEVSGGVYKSLAERSGWISHNNWERTFLPSSNPYSWNVRAYNGFGESEYSSERTFTVINETPTPSPTPTPGNEPVLSIPRRITGGALGGQVTIPVEFDPVSRDDISGQIFSVDYDEQSFTFSPEDSDNNGIPDAITFSDDVPADFTRTVFVDEDDTDGELDFSLSNRLQSSLTLSKMTIAEITFEIKPDVTASEIAVGFSKNPVASSGSSSGQSISTQTEDGSVLLAVPELSLDTNVKAHPGEFIGVKLFLKNTNEDLNCLKFSLNYDSNLLFISTEPSVNIQFQNISGFEGTATVDKTRIDRKVDITISQTKPTASLPTGENDEKTTIAVITFSVIADVSIHDLPLPIPIHISDIPAPLVCGESTSTLLPVRGEDGGVVIIPPYFLYLPIVIVQRDSLNQLDVTFPGALSGFPSP